MKLEKQDIVKLYNAATEQERRELASIMDYSSDEGCAPKGEALADHLWWKYQTPIGYLTRTPFFNGICSGVGKIMKLEGIMDEKVTCWKNLHSINKTLFEKWFDDLESDQKEDLAKAIFTAEELQKLGEPGMIDWTKVTSISIFALLKQYGGFSVYKFKLIIANQITRSLLGKGLNFTVKSMLIRTVPFSLGPLIWLLLVLNINELFGTNWKRVVPAVLYTGCIYDRLQAEQLNPI